MGEAQIKAGSLDGGKRRWARRREARPGEILAAALDCFAARGFAATRLDDVAARAGVTKGTLYLYFPNKEALFKAVVRESLVPLLERVIGDLSASGGDPRERIQRLMSFFVKEVLDSPLSVIPKLIISEAENFPEIASFYMDEVIGRGKTFISQAIREGVELGVFRQVDPDNIVYSVVSPMLMASLWRHSLEPYDVRPLDAESMIRDHLELVFRGLAPDPSTRKPKARTR